MGKPRKNDGRNEGDNQPHADVINSTAQRQLKSVIDRVERLEVEKAEVAEQIKDVYAEAKGNGFDVKILRKIVRLRKMDAGKRQEEEAITDLYMHAIGEAEPFEPAAPVQEDEDDEPEDDLD